MTGTGPGDVGAVGPVVRQGVVVGATVALTGVSFGALAVLAGLEVWQACFLSLVMFTGGSQFAFVGVLAVGGVASLPSGIAAASLLGVRNLFYAVRLAPLLRGAPLPVRLLAAHLTIDESTAVAVAQPTPRLQRVGFWAAGLTVFAGWNACTLVGALVGDAIGDVRAYGLDAAAAAAFLALLRPRLRRRQAQAVAVGAAVVAAALLPVLPTGLPVLLTVPVAVLVGVTGLLGPPRPDERAAGART